MKKRKRPMPEEVYWETAKKVLTNILVNNPNFKCNSDKQGSWMGGKWYDKQETMLPDYMKLLEYCKFKLFTEQELGHLMSGNIKLLHGFETIFEHYTQELVNESEKIHSNWAEYKSNLNELDFIRMSKNIISWLDANKNKFILDNEKAN